MTCTPRCPGALGQAALRLQLGELRLVVGVGNGAGAQPVADGKTHVVGGHDFADFVPVRKAEIFLVMGQAPFGQNGAAAADDAGGAPRGQGDEPKQDARVNSEIIHPLLALFQEGVAINLPSQVLGLAADFFQRLINGHGADGHGRVAQNPLACGVNVFAGGQIHHRVRAPLDGPAHFFHFLADGGGDGGVADVGVDFHQEIAADDHRLQFRMVDVAGDDGAASRDLGADKFRRDFPRNGRAEGLAGMLRQERALAAIF